MIVEDSFECPLSELNIIQETTNASDAKTYQFIIGEKPTLDNYVFCYALDEFWKNNYPDQETLTIDKITYDFSSPGKVFKIDELSIANRLSELEHLTNGHYRWTDTTGLNQISKNTEVKFSAVKFLEKSYKELQKRSGMTKNLNDKYLINTRYQRSARIDTDWKNDITGYVT